MKFKRITCVRCGNPCHYSIDDKAHCNSCIADIIKDKHKKNGFNLPKWRSVLDRERF